MDLAEEYVEFEKTATSETTVDDFFDHCKIPADQRTNFVFAAILKQVQKLVDPLKKEG